MDKQAQDKLWHDLSEESKKKVLEDYMSFKNSSHSHEQYKASAMEDMFGEHNLNPKPQIKTWEDVENYLEIIPDFKEIIHNLDAGCCNQKVINKIIATYKISRIIDLGYGGIVSEEEWKDLKIPKYSVIYHPTCQDEKLKFDGDEELPTEKHFIAFHTPEQREEFMSHESNRKLVEQYYMM